MVEIGRIVPEQDGIGHVVFGLENGAAAEIGTGWERSMGEYSSEIGQWMAGKRTRIRTEQDRVGFQKSVGFRKNRRRRNKSRYKKVYQGTGWIVQSV